MIRCIAIDDEPVALAIIQDHCRNYGGIVLETFTSPPAGMERIAETRPDIVFLDIEMNAHNGVLLARRLPESTCLIFTTAYSEYAIDGFEADAVDFLRKPIFFPRFRKAVDKARAWIEINRRHASSAVLTLKADYKTVVVDPADILFVEAMDNYVKVFRRALPTVVSQITMKELESLLPAGAFCRVHRSFIVALDAIEHFSSRSISLRGVGRPIPVGRTYVDSFINRQNNFKFIK